MLFLKRKGGQPVPSPQVPATDHYPATDHWMKQSDLLWAAHDAAKDADVQRDFRFKLGALERKHQHLYREKMT